MLTDDEKVDELFNPYKESFSESDRRFNKIMLSMVFSLTNSVRVLEGKQQLTKQQFKTRIKARMLE